ncbi:site-specific DNA-methyltransferase [Planctomycetota bacterium]
MAKKKKSLKNSLVSIDSVKHKDKRKNIPTEDLINFVSEELQKPVEVKYPGLLYARDPSLDPQLVWQGKDVQDAEELTVPAVPIYIQEKIHPQAIIEDVRAQSKKDHPEPDPMLFADFNGIDFEQMIEFYQHDANWSNRMIMGDSLLVMTSLAEKEGLKGQVQMIYIDPPYGIKFGSNWQISTRKRDVKDGKAADATRQPEQIRAFRDTWELGIHSYLSYWRDRLIAARELLTETGSIFVQIGDENVHLVRCILDEVFGSDNFIAIITIKKTAGLSKGLMPEVTDFVLWYAKKIETVKRRTLFLEKDLINDPAYNLVQTDNGEFKSINCFEELPKELVNNILRYQILLAAGLTPTCVYPVEIFGNIYMPTAGRSWSTNKHGMTRLIKSNRVTQAGNSLNYIRFGRDNPVNPLSNFWSDTASGSGMDKIYVVQTNTKVIERCLLMATDPGDLVLDPTCGSGATAYVAEQWGRRWITIDTSRVALTLARTRLMTGRFPYYILSDSPEGIKKEAEITGLMPPPYKTGHDIKKGFVYQRVPHIMLKDIANNEEIDVIHERWQENLEPLRKDLNKLLKQSTRGAKPHPTDYEEWEIPREPEKGWPKEAKDLLKKWWDYRLQRQKQIDDSIARNADTELLYDQPYVDNKRVRVSGPFTVESLSPHRTISVAKKKQLAEVPQEGWTMKIVGGGQFGNIIIENLKKAGVQNTIKNERLKFDRLEPFAGLWIHAEGEYTEKDGTSRRAAVSIGPEHGTVGPELVKEAAKEAVQGIGFDLLIVCGFAFDPHVSEETKRYGKLTVLPARINADIQFGDEFLKKTGSANLFTVFGEPDLKVNKTKDKKIEVEIKGLDIYDPTTGEIRSNTTDEIACWFIDTNYNEESFFVRHAYFTGADQPYDKLKRALRAEINEEAWSMLYTTTSRPFDPPESGKIAVKVINHYGDEVLKVYEINNKKKSR